jgi:hypothetical protein
MKASYFLAGADLSFPWLHGPGPHALSKEAGTSLFIAREEIGNDLEFLAKLEK